MMKRIFYFLVTILLCVACSDDEQFTTSRSDVLTLPDDTLKMDTVFSGQASSTYTFWIRNQNSKALRVSDVRLAGGSNGFRVNVDGEYLHPSVSGLEILGKDSILVFVEVTAPKAGQQTPKPLDEQLILTLESGIQQEVKLRAWTWDVERWDNKTITADEEVKADKPILVFGKLTIAPEATLRLRGTTLYFHDGAYVDVQGSLDAEEATLRGDRLDRMFPYLPYDHISGQWRGLVVRENARLLLTDCDVHGANEAIFAEKGSSIELTGTTVHNTAGIGINATECTVVLDHCLLSNAEGHLLTAKGCQLTMSHCILAQYYPFAMRDVALHLDEGTKHQIEKMVIAGYEDELIARADDVEELSDEQYFVAEKDDFVLIDEENLIYDFNLKPDSEAAKFMLSDNQQ
jgi:hypothetical protein